MPLEQARRVFRHYQRQLEKDLGPLTSVPQKGDLESIKQTVVELRRKVIMCSMIV